MAKNEEDLNVYGNALLGGLMIFCLARASKGRKSELAVYNGRMPLSRLMLAVGGMQWKAVMHEDGSSTSKFA